MTIRKVFVANRGEIALRIIRAARALGIKTVQAVSAADKEMLAARLVDETVEIGPAHATKSYLNEAAVVEAAVASGADAVHPGYGFLAENAECAENVDGAGLIFVGPAPETIRVMGDKAMAREPSQRYPTATALAVGAARVLAAAGTAPQTPPPAARPAGSPGAASAQSVTCARWSCSGCASAWTVCGG